MCNIDFELPYKCSDKFSKFLRQRNFLEDVRSYIHRLNNLSQEETYMKRNLVVLFGVLGYVDKVVSSEATPRKPKKRSIKTCLQVETA